jgi:hypothetical protein
VPRIVRGAAAPKAKSAPFVCQEFLEISAIIWLGATYAFDISNGNFDVGWIMSSFANDRGCKSRRR